MADFMILLKVARTINTPTRDSYVDICGYAGIAGELAETKKKNPFHEPSTFAMDDEPTAPDSIPSAIYSRIAGDKITGDKITGVKG
jgi:hypothetical protein